MRCCFVRLVSVFIKAENQVKLTYLVQTTLYSIRIPLFVYFLFTYEYKKERQIFVFIQFFKYFFELIIRRNLQVKSKFGVQFWLLYSKWIQKSTCIRINKCNFFLLSTLTRFASIYTALRLPISDTEYWQKKLNNGILI